MADFGLNYIQLKSTEGTYQYQLDPDIEQLGNFPGVTGQNMSYFGKQLVAREVELEQVRRAQPKAASKGPSAKITEIKEGSSRSSKSSKKVEPRKQKPTAELPNHLQTLKPKQINEKVKQVVSTYLYYMFGFLLVTVKSRLAIWCTKVCLSNGYMVATEPGKTWEPGIANNKEKSGKNP